VAEVKLCPRGVDYLLNELGWDLGEDKLEEG